MVGQWINWSLVELVCDGIDLWTIWNVGEFECRQVAVCGRVVLWTNYSVKSGSVYSVSSCVCTS